MTAAPNVALLRQTMDAVLAHPELHRQSMWATRTDCGTAYCYAGMACHLSGIEPAFDVWPAGTTIRTAYWVADGREIGAVAQELLGLDDDSAAALFRAANTTADLKHYVDQIAVYGRVINEVTR